MKPVIGIAADYIYVADIVDMVLHSVSGAEEEGKPVINNPMITMLMGSRWNYLSESYAYAIRKAGGIPVLLPVTEDPEDALRAAEKMDGILFPGGSDIDSRQYGEEPIEGAGVPQTLRDRYELSLLRALLKTDKPILCICRGCHLLNTVLGGTLHQDLELDGMTRHALLEYPRSAAPEEITIQPGSLLHEIVGRNHMSVNSIHHQGVKKPGKGLVVAAVSKEEVPVVEALELPERRAFTLAVQWHPEELVDTQPESFALFRALISSCTSPI